MPSGGRPYVVGVQGRHRRSLSPFAVVASMFFHGGGISPFRMAVFAEFWRLTWVPVSLMEEASGMVIDGVVRGRALTTYERMTITAAVNVVLYCCQVERTAGKIKAAARARRKVTALASSGEGLDLGALSDAVLQVCYALGCGAFPRATPRWWMKRQTGGTWEDLRQSDDATDDYFRDKLRMSPRVFREIAETLSPYLQRRVTFYRVPLQPDHIVAYALYRWASGETYDSGTCSFGIGRASGITAVRDAQVVVDMNLHVLDVLDGYPGSVHDMRMLHLSSLWERAESGQLFTGPHVMLPFGVRTNGYLLGDNGYPQSEWIVVPYGGLAQHPTEARFDNKQKTARGAVERAFGRLKGMWRLFLRTHKCNMDTLPQQFIAVCILHNILINAGIPFDDNLLWEVGPDGVRRRVDLGMHAPLHPVCMESSTGDALILRDALAERMGAQ
ncbi:hypothetical protein CBR_g50656 [Chara braunii]|uniref:DDE Tnp4 domain-containing protein n=1 Tax=Chara braunii TaxID=69332 RepID=A0A388M751_CHABU|nr:hypothetical protein CBR_g50656 [Chara braunii]|eukprot:GBG90408.1 hypothetical protein CBR_g50656 [Chara braunii]